MMASSPETPVNNFEHDNDTGFKIIRSHVILSESSLSQIKQRGSLALFKTINEVPKYSVKFDEHEPGKKLTPTDYRNRLKILSDAGIRPNILASFNSADYLTYHALLHTASVKDFAFGKNRCIEFPFDRILPQAYKVLYNWTMSEKLLHVGCFELLDTIDPWTYLYRNIGTDLYYDYVFDKSLVNYKAFLFFWEMKRVGYKYGRLILNNRIKNCFLDLVANVQFVQLDIAEVCIILASSNIGVNSELEVFMAAIMWLSYDWNGRKGHVNTIMKCVRFKLMEPWLLTWLSKDKAMEVRRMISLKSVDDLLQEALEFAIAKLYFERNPVDFEVFRMENNFIEPEQRSWIYDKNCPYHHREGCQYNKGLTYHDFMKCMSVIRAKGRDYWKTFTPQNKSACSCRRDSQGLNDFMNDDLPKLLDTFEKQRKNKVKLYDVLELPITKTSQLFNDCHPFVKEGERYFFKTNKNPQRRKFLKTTLTQFSNVIEHKEVGSVEQKSTNETEVTMETHRDCNKPNSKKKRKMTIYRKNYRKSLQYSAYSDKYVAGLKYLNELIIDSTDGK